MDHSNSPGLTCILCTCTSVLTFAHFTYIYNNRSFSLYHLIMRNSYLDDCLGKELLEEDHCLTNQNRTVGKWLLLGFAHRKYITQSCVSL